MSFTGPALTFRRFRIYGEAPSNATIRAGIEKYTFDAKPRARSEEPNYGWAELGQAGKSCLVPFVAGSIVAASVRFDRKRINGAAFALACDAKYEEVMKARGVERIGANHKQEIKEALKEDLLGQAFPAVSMVDLVWSLDVGEVWIFASSDTAVDLVRGLFHDSFGTRLFPDRPHDWLPAESKPAPRYEDGIGFDCNDAVESRPEAMPGFLTFLMGDEGQHLGWWLEDKALFADIENGRALLSGPGLAPDSPEVETITVAGKTPASIKVGYRPPDGESEWRGTLKVHGPTLEIAGLKLPAVVKDGAEEMVLERHYLLGLFLAAVRSAFVMYWETVVAGGVSEGDRE